MKNQDFKQLFDGSKEGILICDENNNIFYFNPEIRNIIPDLPDVPEIKDFESAIDFTSDFGVEVSFDLFEIDYLILTTKK
jgi:PAS domain-containing protein